MESAPGACLAPDTGTMRMNIVPGPMIMPSSWLRVLDFMVWLADNRKTFHAG